MNLLWYMCAPDGAYPWNPAGSRRVDYGYFRQLAIAYDQLGYTGALFATGSHDVWVLAASLLPLTERLKFLVAIHPGLVPVTLLGKMAATLQEFSGNRVMINVVSGDAKMLGAYGMTLPHDTARSRAPSWRCLPAPPSRRRRFGSAAPPTPRSTSPPGTSTRICPGARRRSRCGRRWTR